MRLLLTVLLMGFLAFAESPGSEVSWKGIFDLLSKQEGGTSAEFANLTASEVSDVRRETAKSIDQSCRETLNRWANYSILKKLTIFDDKLTTSGQRILIVQGGEDSEDVSDNCFGDGHLNFDFWVFDFSGSTVTVRLKTRASDYAVLRSGASGCLTSQPFITRVLIALLVAWISSGGDLMGRSTFVIDALR